MAVQLESEIMAAIGFHSNYRWFNGSGSCGHIAVQAAEKVGAAIQAAHDADPTAIGAPMPSLISRLREVARNEPSRYELTSTWEFASDVIVAHIHDDNPAYGRVVAAAMAQWLDEHRRPSYDDMFGRPSGFRPPKWT